MAQNETAEETIVGYALDLRRRKSEATARSYVEMVGNIVGYLNATCSNGKAVLARSITEDDVVRFFASRKSLAYNTVSVYRYAALDWCMYLTSRGLCSLDVPKLKQQIKPFVPRRVIRPPAKADPNDVVTVVTYALSLTNKESINRDERLRQLRDRAFIVFLADTGIDVSAATRLCSNCVVKCR